MADFRSKSYKDTRTTTQSENDYKIRMQRCYSTSYATCSANSAAGAPPQSNGSMEIVVAENDGGEQWKFKKGRSIGGFSTKSWRFEDPELQRKKRVAGYKVYSVEGKVKGSIKKSFRWIKESYSKMIYGHR